MNKYDPKVLQKSKSISSREQSYFALVAMRSPLAYVPTPDATNPINLDTCTPVLGRASTTTPTVLATASTSKIACTPAPVHLLKTRLDKSGFVVPLERLESSAEIRRCRKKRKDESLEMKTENIQGQESPNGNNKRYIMPASLESF